MPIQNNSQIQLSIIIVNYFGKEIIKNCVQSIISDLGNFSYEIIIVDNSNDDETRKLLAPYKSQITWIELGYNAGFGRANNAAFEIMKGNVALLLNPDCISSNNVIEQCYERFVHSQYVACGINLLNEDGSFQISGSYVMKGGLNYLLPLPYLGKFIKWLGDIAKVKKPHEANPSANTEVDWITGAFLMVKKETIITTKGFDEDFFLYAEDSEWCSRIQQAGPLVMYGDLSITHLSGALATEAFEGESSSYKTLHDKKGLQIMLSNLVRIRKQFGLFWYLFISNFYYLSVPVFLIVGIIHSIFTFKNQLKNFVSYSKNIIILFSYSPRIIANKPYFYKVL